jgi:hypothetical protein
MNKFARDMLMARYGKPDSRRGDYSDGRRDYGYDYARRDMRYSSDAHYEPYYDMARRDYEQYQQYPNSRERDMRRDYDDYGDYARRDYHQTEYGKMSEKDIKCWSEALMNSDGTKGEHFKKDQAEHIAKQLGIDTHRFGGGEVFTMTMNMVYADYCNVAKKFNVDRPEFYAEFAKAFLDDKDFHGEGEEKLWLYYKCIAEQE